MARTKSAEAMINKSRIVSTGCFMGLFICGCGFLLPLLSWRVPVKREAYLLVGWLL